MTSSRSLAAPTDETRADTIPAPPPSAATLEGDDAPESRVESRAEARRRDTIPAAPAVPTFDVPATDDAPATDRAPFQLDAV